MFINHFADEVIGTNCCEPIYDFKTICGDFNGSLEGKRLLVIEEPSSVKGSEWIKFQDKLKDNITRDLISIRKMRTDAYTVHNRVRIIVAANRDNSIKIEACSERWLIMSTTEDKKTKAFWTETFDRLQSNGCAIAWGMKQYAEANRKQIVRLLKMRALSSDKLAELKTGSRKKSIDFFVDLCKRGDFNKSPKQLADDYNQFARTKITNLTIGRYFKKDIGLTSKRVTYCCKQERRFVYTQQELCELLWASKLVVEEDDLPFDIVGTNMTLVPGEDYSGDIDDEDDLERAINSGVV